MRWKRTPIPPAAGKPKSAPDRNFNWRAWRARRTARLGRAPKMRRGTAEERAAFADEIRAKTKLFGDGQ